MHRDEQNPGLKKHQQTYE